MNFEKKIKNSEVRRQFEQFRNKRSEKTTLLQCESQSLTSKIKCFQELFKLTKKGTVLNNNKSSEVAYTFCNSTKNIGQNRAQVSSQENSQLVAQKLEKMVYGLRGWGINKTISNDQNSPPSIQQICHHSSTNQGSKFKKNHYKSAAISRIKYGVSLNQYVQQLPNKKYWKIKRSVKGLRNSHSVNNFISITTPTPSFTNLKTKITEYQSKAKNKYGISFEIIKNNEQEYPKEIGSEFVVHESTRVASMTQIKKDIGKTYIQLVKQCTKKEDSSIPTSFLGLIRSVSGKPRQMAPKDSIGYRYIRV